MIGNARDVGTVAGQSSFDAQASVSDEELLSLLEAARWAPSANKSQPWRFAVVRRQDSLFATVVDALVGFNKSWAPRAAAFIIVGVEAVDSDGRDRFGVTDHTSHRNWSTRASDGRL